MFRISREQLAVFEQQQVRSFEQRMVEHLARCFPEQCRALGPGKVVAAIRHGIDHAAGYRLITERDVCKYVDLMFTFGRDFDTDPECPWAARHLDASSHWDPSTRIDRTMAAAERHLRTGAPSVKPR